MAGSARKRANSKAWYYKNREKVLAKRRRTDNESVLRRLVNAAKRRAKERGLPCDFDRNTWRRLSIPTHCPVLGIKLVSSRGTGVRTDATPSLDRIVPILGYVESNVRIISWRANHLKTDGTPEELMLVAQNAHDILLFTSPHEAEINAQETKQHETKRS